MVVDIDKNDNDVIAKCINLLNGDLLYITLGIQTIYKRIRNFIEKSNVRDAESIRKYTECVANSFSHCNVKVTQYENSDIDDTTKMSITLHFKGDLSFYESYIYLKNDNNRED